MQPIKLAEGLVAGDLSDDTPRELALGDLVCSFISTVVPHDASVGGHLADSGTAAVQCPTFKQLNNVVQEVTMLTNV